MVTRGAWYLWAVFVFAVPCVLYYTYLVNGFYHYGTYFFDGGLFAHVVWHNDLSLTAPWPRADYSYMGIHFMPILWLANILSYALPLYMAEFLSLFLAATYGLIALSMFYTLQFFLDVKKLLPLMLAALLSLAVTFNALIVNALWLPHVEFAIPLGVFMFMVHYALGNRKWAALWFVLLLFSREDAGLHLAASMGLVMLADYYRTRDRARLKRHIAVLAMAIGYSVAALIIVTLISLEAGRGLSSSVFHSIYLGNPAYAHLNSELLIHRITRIATERASLFAGVGLMAVWAIATRNLTLGIGLFAALPWLILNLCAYHNPTGIIYAYYIFPATIYVFWPVIAALWRHGRDIPADERRGAVILQLLVAGVMMVLVGPHDYTNIRLAPVELFQKSVLMPAPSREHRERMLRLVMLYENERTLEHRGADTLALSLARLARPQSGLKTARNLRGTLNHMLYMSSDRNHADTMTIAIQRYHGLTRRYCLPAASLCLLTRVSKDQLGKVGEMLEEVPVPKTWADNRSARDIIRRYEDNTAP